MNDYCNNCGEELMFVESERTRSSFCSDRCKVEYYNERRKIDRARERIHDAIDMLEELSKGDTALSFYALEKLSTVTSRMEDMQHEVNFVCNQCGQTRFSTPSAPCSYCGHESWRPVKR